MQPFAAVDMNGKDFWIEWDGADGIGFWVGSPENSAPLSTEVSDLLVEWVFQTFKIVG